LVYKEKNLIFQVDYTMPNYLLIDQFLEKMK